MIRFRDADTGHFVSRQTWLRQLRNPTRDIRVEEFERRAPVGQGKLFTAEQLAQPASAERRASDLSNAQTDSDDENEVADDGDYDDSDGVDLGGSDDGGAPGRENELSALNYQLQDLSHLDFDEDDIEDPTGT